LTDGASESGARAKISPENRDAYRPEAPRSGLALKDDLVMALRFFSRLPTGNRPHEKPDLGRIAVVLPLASVIMGLVPILLLGGVWLGLPGYFAAALAVGAMVIVGGGMMEDSLADSADGLFGGATRERRLEILKDSRHGTYGVAALSLFLLLRVTALGSVATVNPLAAAGLWLAANIAGRSGALWVAVALPPARAEGASASAGSLPVSRFLIGAVFAALLALVIGTPASSLFGAILAVVAVGLVVLGWTALCRRLVGGQTGDLIGAAAGLGEVAALAVLLIFV
jgi:adenosylcobinamide-GDP ribazoletransferase